MDTFSRINYIMSRNCIFYKYLITNSNRLDRSFLDSNKTNSFFDFFNKYRACFTFDPLKVPTISNSFPEPHSVLNFSAPIALMMDIIWQKAQVLKSKLVSVVVFVRSTNKQIERTRSFAFKL